MIVHEVKDVPETCPLLAQSEHRLVRCTCLLLTQSGHRLRFGRRRAGNGIAK